MADVKISALGALTTVAKEDLLAIIDDPAGTPASRKITVEDIFDVTTLLTDKASPVVGDEIPISDSAASGVSKKISITNLDTLLAGTTKTLTNKTINTANNTITINEADISDLGSYITASSTDTLTNKTINLTSNTFSSTLAQLNTAVSDATLVDLDDSQTLTNKTIDADNNTVSNLAIGAEVGTTLTETQEVWIPAGSFTSATTNGAEITSRETTTNKVNYHYAGFDTTTSESAWFTWTPPANWDAGTVRFKLYWTNTGGASAETIDFDLAAVAFANDDLIDTAVGVAKNVTDTWIAQDDLHITAYSAAITIAGTPAAGEEVHFKLSRDVAADNLTGDCDVIGIQLEYSVNDIGTT